MLPTFVPQVGHIHWRATPLALAPVGRRLCWVPRCWMAS